METKLRSNHLQPYTPDTRSSSRAARRLVVMGISLQRHRSVLLVLFPIVLTLHQAHVDTKNSQDTKVRKLITDPAQGKRLPKNCITGQPVHYYIEGLGTARVVAYAQCEGQKLYLSGEIQRRSNGEDRSFKINENLFDQITGKQWNWVGSDRSGGASQPIKPNGVGDVNAACANDFDCSAKKHDIQFWLQLCFEPGTLVSLKIADAEVRYEVKPENIVNKEVIDEFLKAAESALSKALHLAERANDEERIASIRELQSKLRDDGPSSLYNRTRVIHTVLTDPAFRSVL